MDRSSVILVSIIVAALVAASVTFAWRSLQPSGSSTGGKAPMRVAFDVSHVGGSPQMNTTDFWVARITQVSANESLSRYEVTLLRNGSVLVDSVTVQAGQLGDSTHPIFEFFDNGLFCYPVPCPPPEGPDGNLTVDDYFRISYPDPGTAYTVRVIWAATREVAGEIIIQT